MNVRQAFQFTKILQLGSWLLVIAIPSVGIQMTVDVAMGNPHLKSWENQIQPPAISSTTPQPPSPSEIVAMCTQGTLVEIPPTTTPIQPIAQPEPIAVAQVQIELPFEWAGVALPEKSSWRCVILLDKRTQRQILVREGKLIPGTKYRVVQIGSDEAKIQLGNTFGIVAKPKPWQRIHLESDDAPLPTDDITGPVLSETNTVIQEDESLLRCGLHEGDQVIAIEKQPVANVTELTKAVAVAKKEFLLLTITRQEQPLLLLLPTLTVKQLLRLGNSKPY